MTSFLSLSMSDNSSLRFLFCALFRLFGVVGSKGEKEEGNTLLKSCFRAPFGVGGAPL